MKTQPHSNNRSDNGHWNRAPSERRSNIDSFRSPPAFPHRRYPSLYEDFEPWIPRNRPTHRPVATPATSTHISLKNNRSRFPYVRLIALVAIVVIIAALAASA